MTKRLNRLVCHEGRVSPLMIRSLSTEPSRVGLGLIGSSSKAMCQIVVATSVSRRDVR